MNEADTIYLVWALSALSLVMVVINQIKINRLRRK
jgi:hypothetical protein